MGNGETDQPAEPMAFGIGVLFSSTRDAVVVGDARTGRIVLWSPSAERIFGYSVAEALGMSIERLVPPALATAHRTGLGRFAATGHGSLIDGDEPAKLPARHKSGRELTLTRVNGLGLYLCRDIVVRHGGRIWAESDGPDRGTAVFVWLPSASAGVAVGARGD